MKLVIASVIVVLLFTLKVTSANDTMVIRMKNSQIEKYAVSQIQKITFEQATTQIINLHYGWNIISSFINPSKTDIDSMFSGISDSILIMKNDSGQYFYPYSKTNQIGNWNINDGYLVYAKNACSLKLNGISTCLQSTQIPLKAGWSLVTYNRSYNMPIEQALAGLSPNLVLAMDNDKIFFPDLNFNSIVNMEPGKGYWIYLVKPDTLIYPTLFPIENMRFVFTDGTSKIVNYGKIDSIFFTRPNNIDYFNAFTVNMPYFIQSRFIINTYEIVYDRLNFMSKLEYFINNIYKIDSINFKKSELIGNVNFTNTQWYSVTDKIGGNHYWTNFYLYLSGSTNADNLFILTKGDGISIWHSLNLNDYKEFKDTVDISFILVNPYIFGRETSEWTFLKAIKGTDTTYYMLESDKLYY
jgi:hypothetical protein